MRMKLLTSILAFALTMFVSLYLALSLQSSRLLSPAEFERFSNVVIVNAVLHQTENGGARSFQLAVKAAAHPDGFAEIDAADGKLSVTLPKYSVRQADGTYLTIASEAELGEYFRVKLPESDGWRYIDQMGAGHFYERDDVKMVITEHKYLGASISEINISIVSQ